MTLRGEGIPLAWLVLVGSGLVEAVWATALSRSEGLTRPVAVAVFVVALLVSMSGLAYALRTIPVGTGYAVWTAVGAAAAVAWAMATGAEPVTVVRVLLLAGLLACVVGLRLTEG